MLRSIWFFVKVALFVVAAVWVANRPGYVDISWLGYDIHAQVGFVLLFLFIVLLLCLLVYKLFLSVVNFRRYLRQKAKEKRTRKGYRALTLGLSAVAANDAKTAQYQAQRMRHLLPDERGLSYVLEGQAARLTGHNDSARQAFEKLLENEDTAFLGLRGLMTMAMEDGDAVLALSHARKVSKKYAKQPWVIKMMYNLELRAGQWNKALMTLKKGEALKFFDQKQSRYDRIAIYLQQADVALAQEQNAEAGRYLRKAYRLDSSYVPAVMALAKFYLAQHKNRKVVHMVEKAWKEQPHPALTELWGRVVPQKMQKAPAGRLRWFERLVALNPDSAEGKLAAAREALDAHLWGEARHYLGDAEKLRPSARLYTMWAELEEAQDNMEAAQMMLKKASFADAEKAWVCKETGRVYERWLPIAEPHGAFNTIVWDYPKPYKHDVMPFLPDTAGLLMSAKADSY